MHTLFAGSMAALTRSVVRRLAQGIFPRKPFFAPSASLRLDPQDSLRREISAVSSAFLVQTQRRGTHAEPRFGNRNRKGAKDTAINNCLLRGAPLPLR